MSHWRKQEGSCEIEERGCHNLLEDKEEGRKIKKSWEFDERNNNEEGWS